MITPSLHFKDGQRSSAYIDELYHLGAIQMGQPFAIPLFSLYVPYNMDTSIINKSKYNKDSKITYHDLYVNETVDNRIDIFVTPKGIDANKVLSSVIGFIYNMIDVDTFSSPIGELVLLEEEITQSRKNINFGILHLKSGHDVIYRTVSNQHKKFTMLEGTYSILIHDPNGIYERLTNRPFLSVDEGEEINLTKINMLNKVYEEQITEDEEH